VEHSQGTRLVDHDVDHNRAIRSKHLLFANQRVEPWCWRGSDRTLDVDDVLLTAEAWDECHVRRPSLSRESFSNNQRFRRKDYNEVRHATKILLRKIQSLSSLQRYPLKRNLVHNKPPDRRPIFQSDHPIGRQVGASLSRSECPATCT
jgi:hypothetical protein